MERPYAIGGGLRQLVDFFQHHVAFTTHPHLCSPGNLVAGAVPRRHASDCSADRPLGQQPMPFQSQSDRKQPSDVSTRQTVRSFARFAVLGWLLWLSTADAQIYDSLDVHPPRWYLDTSDCEARVTAQGHLADGGVSGGACETITFVATHGMEALLVYPIEPVRPLDALTANLSVMMLGVEPESECVFDIPTFATRKRVGRLR